MNDNFFALGGDSILSLQVIAKAHQAGLKLTPRQLFEHQTIAALAAVAGNHSTTQAEQGLVRGAVPLTPIQHWFFEQNFPHPHHWNQAVLLHSQQRLQPDLIESAIAHLLTHHDALRSQFIPQENGWQQIISANVEPPAITIVDLSNLPATEQAIALEKTANELQVSLNLATGNLLKVALFDLGVHQPQRLLWIIHHLVVDGVSWRILLEDFQAVYQQLSQQKAVQLPAKTTAFPQWSERLSQQANSLDLHQELDFWLRVHGEAISPLPCDLPAGENTVATAQTVSVMLSETETRSLLQEVLPIHQAQINEVLLAALSQVLTTWVSHYPVLVDLEGHGREDLFADVDVSRTVGWFTTVFPILLQPATSRCLETLHRVKQQLQQISHHGIGYGLLRYLGAAEVQAQLKTVPQAQILFNYLGQFDASNSGFLQLADEPMGSLYHPQAHRNYEIEINCFISQGQLQLNWTYSDRSHHRSTIVQLAEAYLAELRSLITEAPANDFSLIGLDTAALDDIFSRVQFVEGDIE